MTHRERAHYDVFCSSYCEKKKESFDYWLWKPGIFIHSWTCQTECIQTITHECVNRPVVHRYKVTPWQLYSVWGCSLCHPQWFVSFLFLLFCQNDWISTRCFQLIMVRGVASVKFTHLFILWDCVIGNSMLVSSGADLLIQLLIFSLGSFLIPLWLMRVCMLARLQWHKQTLFSSIALKMYVLLSAFVSVPQLAV